MKLPSSVPDKEDRAALKNKSPSYILGWNKVKHRLEEPENKPATPRKATRKPRKQGL